MKERDLERIVDKTIDSTKETLKKNVAEVELNTGEKSRKIKPPKEETKKVNSKKKDTEELEVLEISTKRSKKQLIGMILARTGICLGTLVLLLVIGLLGVVHIIEFGPSKTARNLFVNSALESSAGGILVTMFFSDEEIKEIRGMNSVEKIEDITDSTLVTTTTSELTQEQKEAIEIKEVSGDTYYGKLAFIRDPSRVVVGVSGDYGSGAKGKTVSEIAESYNAVLATNAGGFEDKGGVGNGGQPIGLVIADGELKYGSRGSNYEVIGIDNNNVLVVGDMTAGEALDRGVRDAVSFGPILIVNGEATTVTGRGSGLNPRTAIGQKADGTILLLVIDGRQVNSLGASYSDIIDIMLENGAINAANLDGGSSSLLYYNGEYINNCASLYGPRDLPTAIVVK